MIIAINTRLLSGNEEAPRLLQDCCVQLAAAHPVHQFVFISNQPFTEDIHKLQNVKTVVIPQRSQNPLLWKLWYNYKLPAVLKKHNAELVIHSDIVCSLRTKTRQFVVVNDLSFLHQPAWLDKKYGRFVRSNAAAFLAKAQKIIATARVIKDKIIRQYKIDEHKTALLCPFAQVSYRPLPWNEKELVKEQYAEGKEYFLYTGVANESSNFIHLLKAFSFFKKRQQSNMQLLIVSDGLQGNDHLKENLRLYKYRREVKLLTGVSKNELQKITAAAYAFVHPVLHAGGVTTLLNVMQCAVPVITSAGDTAKEIFDDAVLYANPVSFEDIAAKMMLLFKDETGRAELIRQGDLQAARYGLDKTMAALWQSITGNAG